MRSKAERGRKEDKAQSSKDFQLGDLVICRYSNYPYWPATIDQTHQQKAKGRYMCNRRTRNGESVQSFWCTFSNEDTGGWVRHDRLVRYHPDIVPAILLDSDDDMYGAQKDALKVARLAYDKLPSSSRAEKAATNLPKDYSTAKVNPDDGDMLPSDSSEDESSAEPTPAKGEDEDPMDIGPNSSEDDTPKKRPRKRGASRPAVSSRQNRRRVSAPPEVPVRNLGRGRAKKEKLKEPRKTAGTKRKATATTTTTTGREKKRGKTTVASVERRVKKTLEKPAVEKVEEKVSLGETTLRREKRSLGGMEVATSRSEPRDRSDGSESLQAGLEAAKQTIADLRAELAERDKKLEELGKSTVGVKFTLPNTPENVKMDVPDKADYLSKDVDSETFSSAMDDLRHGFDAFKQIVKDAERERSTLNSLLDELRSSYKDQCDKVVSVESKAVQQEKTLLTFLSKIITMKVEVSDLRQHRAGNCVRALGKTCKQMPAIHAICNEICTSWERQVHDYILEQKQQDGDADVKKDDDDGGNDDDIKAESPADSPEKKNDDDEEDEESERKGASTSASPRSPERREDPMEEDDAEPSPVKSDAKSDESADKSDESDVEKKTGDSADPKSGTTADKADADKADEDKADDEKSAEDDQGVDADGDDTMKENDEQGSHSNDDEMSEKKSDSDVKPCNGSVEKEGEVPEKKKVVPTKPPVKESGKGKATAKESGKASGKDIGKTSGKDSGKASAKDSGKTSAKESSKAPVKDSGKGAAKESTKGGTKEASKGPAKEARKGPSKEVNKWPAKEVGKGPAKEVGKGTVKEAGKASTKQAGKGPAKETGKGSSKETGKGSLKEFGKGSSKETGKGPVKEAGKGPAKESSKGTAKESGNADGKEASKGTSRESSKGTVKESGKGAAKASGKESGKAVSKESGRGSTKETGKGVSKESGKVTGKESGKGPGKETGKSSGKDSGKVGAKETGKNTVKESVKSTAKGKGSGKGTGT